MPVISKRFADELNEKEMRDAYLDERTRARTALQIKSNRVQRGWLQADMGQKMGKPQGNIARLEDREVARYTLTTLLELASVFDCGLVVEFVPYEEFLRRTNDLTPESLIVPGFSRDALEPLCHNSNPVTASSSVPKAYELPDASGDNIRVIEYFDLQSAAGARIVESLSNDVSLGRVAQIPDESVADSRQYVWKQTGDIIATPTELFHV